MLMRQVEQRKADAMDEQELLRKVGLLLKKAEGTDNENEAKTFFEAAQNIMVKYAIDEQRARSVADGSQRRVEEPVVEDFMFSSYAHHATAKQAILEVALKSRTVRWFHYDNKKKSYDTRRLVREAGKEGLYESQWSKLVGYKTDIELAKMLYVSLLIQATKFAADDWRHRYGEEKVSWEGIGKFSWTSTHMEHFAYRVGERFGELADEMYRSELNGNELINDKMTNIVEWMYEHGLMSRPYTGPRTYYCWIPEPEANRPMVKNGPRKGEPNKKWRPKYCLIEKADDKTPHEGEHKFTYDPGPTTYVTYYAKGRTTSGEAQRAGAAAGDRADIGLTRTGSGASLLKG